MKRLSIALLVVPLFLFSCNKDEVVFIGNFSSTITGSVDKKFDGEATFVHNITTSSTPNLSLLSFGLLKGTDESEVITLTIQNSNSDGIATGTYDLDLTGNATTIFIGTYRVDSKIYSVPVSSLTNSITISSVEGLRVKGTFELNLSQAGTQEIIKVVGNFDASGITNTN